MEMVKSRRVENLVIGGSLAAIKRALELSDSGFEVMLAVEESFLGGNDSDCGGDWLVLNPAVSVADGFFYPHNEYPHDVDTPDERKKELERLLKERNIYFCYGLYYLKMEEDQHKYIVSFGTKGGIYQVWCETAEDYSDAVVLEQSGKITYSAWVERGDERLQGGGKQELLKVETEACLMENQSPAEILLSLQKEVMIRYAERKRREPGLILGRFGNLLKQVGRGDEDSTEEAYEVIVAGGGTSGAMAAIHAARGGARTLLLEPGYGLGGTATLGGVSTYWFGMRFNDVKEIDEETDRISKEYGIEQKMGIWSDCDDFHPGVRSHVLLKLCLEAGVEVRLGRLVCGTIVEGSRVSAVRTAGWDGERIYRGSIIMDATGDGDLAVFSGAESHSGSERDGLTYWASLAQYTTVRNYKNNFSSTTVCDDPEEMTRFICIGRKRGENTFDHGSYVSMRESRHIRGVKQLNLRDLCLGSTWEDGLYTCFSNYDPKGKVDADMIYCGYLPPQARIQIPLGALMPLSKDGALLQGLYVAGKAISVSHNLFPSIRMQPDLMHQGAVLGMLAAEAINQNCLIEQLSTEVRKRMIAEKTGDRLEPPFFAGDSEREVYEIPRKVRTHSVDLEFTEVEKSLNPLLAAVCQEKRQVLPRLKEQIGRLEGRPEERELSYTLKKLTLWHGCQDYGEEIVNAIRSKLEDAGESLPARAGSVMCAQLLPDHGVMPELVYELNLLSNLKQPPADLFSTVAKRLEDMERNYLNIKQGIYPYVESTAYVAERTGCRELIPALRILIRLPEFRDILDQEKQTELMTERLQILYLALCRALAALEEDEGKNGLLRLAEAPGLAIRRAAETERNRKNKLIHNRLW